MINPCHSIYVYFWISLFCFDLWVGGWEWEGVEEREAEEAGFYFDWSSPFRVFFFLKYKIRDGFTERKNRGQRIGSGSRLLLLLLPADTCPDAYFFFLSL